MKIEIKNRWTKEIIFSIEADSMKNALEIGVKQKINFRNCDFRNCDLRGCSFFGANFRGSTFSGCDLSKVNFRICSFNGSTFSGCNFSESSFYKTAFCGSDFSGCNFNGSIFCKCNFRGCDLYCDWTCGIFINCNFRKIRLFESDLSSVKSDFWDVLKLVPEEIKGLKKAIIHGKVNGSVHDGEYACLFGIISYLRKFKYNEINIEKHNIKRPIERFFSAIKKNDTPWNSQFSKLAVEWIDEFLIGGY